jgi:hypothetical protein
LKEKFRHDVCTPTLPHNTLASSKVAHAVFATVNAHKWIHWVSNFFTSHGVISFG